MSNGLITIIPDFTNHHEREEKRRRRNRPGRKVTATVHPAVTVKGLTKERKRKSAREALTGGHEYIASFLVWFDDRDGELHVEPWDISISSTGKQDDRAASDKQVDDEYLAISYAHEVFVDHMDDHNLATAFKETFPEGKWKEKCGVVMMRWMFSLEHDYDSYTWESWSDATYDKVEGLFMIHAPIPEVMEPDDWAFFTEPVAAGLVALRKGVYDGTKSVKRQAVEQAQRLVNHAAMEYSQKVSGTTAHE